MPEAVGGAQYPTPKRHQPFQSCHPQLSSPQVVGDEGWRALTQHSGQSVASGGASGRASAACTLPRRCAQDCKGEGRARQGAMSMHGRVAGSKQGSPLCSPRHDATSWGAAAAL